MTMLAGAADMRREEGEKKGERGMWFGSQERKKVEINFPSSPDLSPFLFNKITTVSLSVNSRNW